MKTIAERTANGTPIGLWSSRIELSMGRNSRAAGLFEVEVKEGVGGRAELVWRKVPAWRD